MSNPPFGTALRRLQRLLGLAIVVGGAGLAVGSGFTLLH